MTKSEKTTTERNNIIKNAGLTPEIIERIYNQLNDYNFNFHTGTNKNRINHCSAWYSDLETITIFDDDNRYDLTVRAIKSYNTIVAMCFVYQNLLVSFGRYSMTTYQHIRKFKNKYASDYYTKECNMEYENWF